MINVTRFIFIILIFFYFDNFSLSNSKIIDKINIKDGIEVEQDAFGYKISLGGRFSDYQPTDDDINKLLKIKNEIYFLEINSKNITNNGFSCLKELLNVEYLILSDSNFNDDSIKYITGLNKLKFLDLSKTKITAKSFPYIARIKNLATLNLSELYFISDFDISMLIDTPNLTALTLYKTNISGKSIKYLKKMKNLEGLDIRKTKISESEYQEFEKWLCEQSPKRCGVVIYYSSD